MILKGQFNNAISKFEGQPNTFLSIWIHRKQLIVMICSITRGLSGLIATKVDDPFPTSCIVLGLGAMGSKLTKRGASVLGLEQFNIPHALGSSREYQDRQQ